MAAGSVEALFPLLASQRAARKAERADSRRRRDRKGGFVLEAERLAAGRRRGGVNRFVCLGVEVVTRLDRVPTMRCGTGFPVATTSRGAASQFASRTSARGAKVIKERCRERRLGSRPTGARRGCLRELMTRWKAAGPAPRDADELLWKRFRQAQDRFFVAKQATMSEQNTEFRVNAQAKERLLAEAEALLPVSDPRAARASYRDVLQRWSAIGKVPREAMRPLESRLRAVDNAIKAAEDDRWQRSNPEVKARAADTAAKLEAQIAALEARAAQAEARGDDVAAREATASAATYREWLAQAQRTASDLGGSV